METMAEYFDRTKDQHERALRKLGHPSGDSLPKTPFAGKVEAAGIEPASHSLPNSCPCRENVGRSLQRTRIVREGQGRLGGRSGSTDLTESSPGFSKSSGGPAPTTGAKAARAFVGPPQHGVVARVDLRVDRLGIDDTFAQEAS